jgi:hypothetical protein
MAAYSAHNGDSSSSAHNGDSSSSHTDIVELSIDRVDMGDHGASIVVSGVKGVEEDSKAMDMSTATATGNAPPSTTAPKSDKKESLSTALDFLTKALQSAASKPFVSLRNDFPKNNQISDTINSNSDTNNIETITKNENEHEKINDSQEENVKGIKDNGKDEWTSRHDALVILAGQQIGIYPSK